MPVTLAVRFSLRSSLAKPCVGIVIVTRGKSLLQSWGTVFLPDLKQFLNLNDFPWVALSQEEKW